MQLQNQQESNQFTQSASSLLVPVSVTQQQQQQQSPKQQNQNESTINKTLDSIDCKQIATPKVSF